MNRAQRTANLRERIKALAGASGLTSEEGAAELSLSFKTVSAHMKEMAERGELHRVGGKKGQFGRYFQSERDMHAFQAKSMAEQQSQFAENRMRLKAHKTVRAQFGPDDPVVGYSADFKRIKAPKPPTPTRTNTHSMFGG